MSFSQYLFMHTIFFVGMYMYKTNWKLTFLCGDVLSQYMWYINIFLSAANASILHSSPLHNIYSLSGLVVAYVQAIVLESDSWTAALDHVMNIYVQTTV